jgi:hypothetical protein
MVRQWGNRPRLHRIFKYGTIHSPRNARQPSLPVVNACEKWNGEKDRSKNPCIHKILDRLVQDSSEHGLFDDVSQLLSILQRVPLHSQVGE